MIDADVSHTERIIFGIKLLPPAIRGALVSSAVFRARHGLQSESQLAFGNSGIRFRRAELFDAIRSFLGNSSSGQAIADADGARWQISLEDRNGNEQIVLSDEKRRLLFSEFWSLSADASTRVSGFDKAADKLNLPASVVSGWREAFAIRAIADDDFEELLSDLRNTPLRVAMAIAEEFRSRSDSDVHTLIPDDARYYSRLVGEPNAEIKLADYVQKTAGPHIQQLIKWRALDGLKLALLMCSHGSISKLIDVKGTKPEVISELYEWLVTKGDRISQLGGIEFGLAQLDSHPQIEAAIVKLVEQIRTEVPEEENGRFGLLSAVIVFVDGELARTQLLRGKPPFWRRLAAIAHASLMERQLIESRVILSEFSKLAKQNRGQFFYLQTLAELRVEPRWLPHFVLSNQLKAEFIGRIYAAGRENEAKIQSTELRALLLGDGPDRVGALLKFPFPYLPGPLEGGIESVVEMPSEIRTDVERQLRAEVLNADSFAGLVNSVLIFRTDQNLARFAAEALRRVKYQLREEDNGDRAFSLLNGLATVAAVTRSPDLANEVRILTRVVRGRGQDKIAADAAMRIGLIAAAANSDLSDWCKFLGDWLTEHSLEDLDKDTALKLRSHIMRLCHIEPKLWDTCAKAEAACAALNATW